jgi:hypothetical protein
MMADIGAIMLIAVVAIGGLSTPTFLTLLVVPLFCALSGGSRGHRGHILSLASAWPSSLSTTEHSVANTMHSNDHLADIPATTA